jgi:hypothetical protein
VLALADAIGPFTGRPLSRCSKLALSQRPPLLTPVDAAYDTTQTGISVLTDAPVSRSLMTSRQRAYRVYTLLGVAALVGFGVGGLTRRVVNQSRAAATASDADYALAVAGSQAPAVVSPNPPAIAPVAQVQTDAGAPLAAAVRPTINASAPSVAALTAPQNAPMRLVRVSPDAGTLKAMVERADAPGAVPAVSSSKRPDMLSVRMSAPKSSAAAPETTAPVPAGPESARDPSNTDDTDPL